MNKKGFTLAELIGVIVVLSLICLITVPAIASVLKTNKKSLCETQLSNILAAAKSYVSENLLSMPIKDGDYKIITIGDLIENGFIEDNIQNPVTKEEIDPEIEITIKKNGKKLDVSFGTDEEEEEAVYNLCIDEDED